MSAQPPGSIDLVLHETEIEREAQLREFDAIDGKSGIILGFAGALAALAPLDRNVLVDIGRVLAVGGALLALAAFWPRAYSVLELRPLREKYLGADPRFTATHLADTKIQIVNETRFLLIEKVRRLKTAMVVLASAALLVGIGSLVG